MIKNFKRALIPAAVLALGLVFVPQSAKTTVPPENYPRMNSAIENLQQAREELNSAPHDFCGHKAQAMMAVDRAIRELQHALKCAGQRH